MRKAELVGPVQLHTATHIHEAVDELGGFIVVLPFLVGGNDGGAKKQTDEVTDARGNGAIDDLTSREGSSSSSSNITSGASSGSGESGTLSVSPSIGDINTRVRVSALQFLVILLKTSKSALKVR